MFVFCNATAVQAGAVAIIAFICVEHLATAVTGLPPSPLVRAVLSALLILGLTGANIVGVRWGSTIQNLTVLSKLVTLLVVTLVAALAAETEPSGTLAPVAEATVERGVLAAIAAALVPAFFSFGGWQHALWIGGEVRSPQRNVPLAIVGGVVIVVVVYLLVNWAYLRLLGHHGVQTAETLAADAVAGVWPGTGRRVIAGAVAVSAFGVLNAQLLSGPRLVYGMARDGRFFRIFGSVHPIFRTPAAAITLMAGIALVLLFASAWREDGVSLLLAGVVFIDGIFFTLTGMALIVLRRKMPDVERPFRVPLYPIVPLLFVAGELAIVTGAVIVADTQIAVISAGVWIVAALVCYLVFFRNGRLSTASS
jgi:APA family basic amino acid/polyamine antiporter